MMPAISADEAALLRAVCLDPWDDLPRLVIADWYEEHGQAERAELIRAECEHARDPSDANRGRSGTAWLRLAALAEPGPDARTLGPWAVFLRGPGRGWSGEIALWSWKHFEAMADAGLWARVPVVRAAARWARPAHNQRRRVWVWARRSGAGGAFVPPRVFDRLAGLASPQPALADARRVGYAAEAAATEALSRAAVDEGRAAAGLPPLAWPAFADPPA